MVREKKGFLPQNKGENKPKHTLDSADSFDTNNYKEFRGNNDEASKLRVIDFTVNKLDEIILHLDGINRDAARSVNDLYEFVHGERSVYSSLDEAYSSMKKVSEVIYKDAFIALRNQTKELLPEFEKLVNQANMPKNQKDIYTSRVHALRAYIEQSEKHRHFEIYINVENAVTHLQQQVKVLKDEIAQLGQYDENKKVWDKKAEEKQKLKLEEEQKKSAPKLEAKDWVSLDIDMPFIEKDISVLEKRYTTLPNFLKTSLLQEAYKNLQENPESLSALEIFNVELLEAEMSEYRELQNQKQVIKTFKPDTPEYNNYLLSIQELEVSTISESDVEKYVPSREELLKMAEAIEENHKSREKVALKNLISSIRNEYNDADESRRVIWLKQLLSHKQGIEYYLSVEAFKDKDTSEHAYAPTSDELPEVRTEDDEPTSERISAYFDEQNLGIDTDATTALAPKNNSYLEVHPDAEPYADTEVLPSKEEPKVIDSTYKYELDKQAPKFEELQSQAQDLLGSDVRSAEVINQWAKRIDDIFASIESAKNQEDELAAREELQNVLNEYNQELQGYRQEQGLAAAGQEVLKQARQAQDRLMELDPSSMTTKELENARKKYTRISILADEINALAQKGTSPEIQLQKREKYEEFRQAQQEFDALFEVQQEVQQNETEQKTKQEAKSWMDDKIEAAREEIDEIKKDFGSLGPLAQAGIQGLEKIYTRLVKDKKSDILFNHALEKFNKIAEQTRWGLQRSLEIATFESVLSDRLKVFGAERAQRIGILLDQYKSNINKFSKEGQAEEEARVFQDLQKRLGIVMESSVHLEAQALEDRLFAIKGETQENQIVDLFKEHAGEWRTLNPFKPDPQSLILKLEEYKTLKQEAESSITALEEAAKEKRLAIETKNNEAVGEVLKEASDEEIDAAIDKGFVDATSESRMAELREKLQVDDERPELFLQNLDVLVEDLKYVEDLIDKPESMSRFVENIDAASKMIQITDSTITLYKIMEPALQWQAYENGSFDKLQEHFAQQLDASKHFVSETGPALLKFIGEKYQLVVGNKKKEGVATLLQHQWERVLQDMIKSYDLILELNKSMLKVKLETQAYDVKIKSKERSDEFDFETKVREGKDRIINSHEAISNQNKGKDQYQTIYGIENYLYLTFEEPAQQALNSLNRKAHELEEDQLSKELKELVEKVKDDLEAVLRDMNQEYYSKVFKGKRKKNYITREEDLQRSKPFVPKPGDQRLTSKTMQGFGDNKVFLERALERAYGETGVFGKKRKGALKKKEGVFAKRINMEARARAEANFYCGALAEIVKWYFRDFVKDEEDEKNIGIPYLRGRKKQGTQLFVAGAKIRQEAEEIFKEIFGSNYNADISPEELEQLYDGDLSKYESLNQGLLQKEMNSILLELAAGKRKPDFIEKAHTQKLEDANQA